MLYCRFVFKVILSFLILMDSDLFELAEREMSKPEYLFGKDPILVVSDDRQRGEHFASYVRYQTDWKRRVFTGALRERVENGFIVVNLDYLLSGRTQGGA